MTAESFTQSSLSTARRCLTEYDLAYNHRLALRRDDEREPLAVGQVWHAAMEAGFIGEDDCAYYVIPYRAPSPLWAEKLSRLYAAHRWYWQDQPVRVVAPEREFAVRIGEHEFRGKMDAIVQSDDGRLGVMEYKTTSDSVDAGSSYWDRLRLDVQVGLYALAARDFEEFGGRAPSFILYDVVRKPSIRPRGFDRRTSARLAHGGDYYGERFNMDDVAQALIENRETVGMYGARLTADIGDDPSRYFARREVPRTESDYADLIANLSQQADLIRWAEDHHAMHRNPDSCNAWGLCQFFGLCSVGTRVRAGTIPDGYEQRQKLHQELS